MPKDDLAWLFSAVTERQPYRRLHADYYAGRHRRLWDVPAEATRFATLFANLRDNLCPSVVDALVDRVQLRGFVGTAGPAVSKATELWDTSSMHRRVGELHFDAPRSGDGFMVVWPDRKAVPRFYPQNPLNCAVLYEEEEGIALERGGKVWQLADKSWRATLYYRNGNERWAHVRTTDDLLPVDPAHWGPVSDEVTRETNKDGVAWVANPWDTVAMFHYANNASVGSLGRSELHDVIPLQDALNKSLADMLTAMEFVAVPQRWATGIEVQRNPLTGQTPQEERGDTAGPFQNGADKLWWTAAAGASFGQFQPGNLDQFLSVQEALRTEIARVSGTPLHYLTLQGSTQAAPGIGLRMLEGRLVKKADDRLPSYGDTHRDANLLALRQYGMSAADQLTREQFDVAWEPTATRDEKYEAEVQEVKQRVGVSKRQSLRELGYDDVLAQKMLDEHTENEAALANAMLASFDRGAPVTAGQGRAMNV